jgi:hypothetical protein
MRNELFTRREAVARVQALIAGRPASAPAPREQLVNVLEHGEQAKANLAADLHADCRGDRTAFDRITLRPRMLQPTLT